MPKIFKVVNYSCTHLKKYRQIDDRCFNIIYIHISQNLGPSKPLDSGILQQKSTCNKYVYIISIIFFVQLNIQEFQIVQVLAPKS